MLLLQTNISLAQRNFAILLKGMQLWVRGENLLAQSYEINLGYPMPKATLMAGVHLSF